MPQDKRGKTNLHETIHQGHLRQILHQSSQVIQGWRENFRPFCCMLLRRWCWETGFSDKGSVELDIVCNFSTLPTSKPKTKKLTVLSPCSNTTPRKSNLSPQVAPDNQGELMSSHISPILSDSINPPPTTTMSPQHTGPSYTFTYFDSFSTKSTSVRYIFYKNLSSNSSWCRFSPVHILHHPQNTLLCTLYLIQSVRQYF